MGGDHALFTSSLGLFACLLCYAASTPYAMPDVNVEWGSGKVNIQCFKEEDRIIPNITSTILYFSKENEAYVNRFNGKVRYIGASNETVQLNDDSSLSIPADYSSIGEYVCNYWRSYAYTKTVTKVYVHEPPLRVSECNTTTRTNHSTLCQVKVPNGTKSLNFTVIKPGLRWPNRTITAQLPREVSILTEKKDPTTNDDNSTTKSVTYEVDVSGLSSSSNLSFVMDGPIKEEVPVVLNKPLMRSDDHDDTLAVGKITGITFAIIFMIGGVAVIIIVILVRSHKCSRTALSCSDSSLS